MTVREYLNNFQSVYGGVTGVIGSLPLVASLLPEKLSRFIFPPLDEIFRVVAVVLVCLTVVVVYFVQYASFITSKKGRLRAVFLTFALAFIGAITFFVANQVFVRVIDIPATGDSIAVTVGFERTPFAEKGELANLDEWQILREHGFREEDIRKVWTARSLVFSRLLLFSSYSWFLLFSVATAGISTLFDGYGMPTNP